MGAEARPPETLGDVLASRRRRRVVGRAGEIELFSTLLESTEPGVLFLHGPGGVGKTTLLGLFTEQAAAMGALVVQLDARQVPPTPVAVLHALRSAGLPEDGHSPRTQRPVLLIDAFERLAPVEVWLRERLLPGLPPTTVTVLAGRTPPGAAWRADPAWRDVLRILSLRNLTPSESRLYLARSGVDSGLHDALVQVSHGHPLGLSLLADIALRGGHATADPLTPEVVTTLLHRFVDVSLTPVQREALGVCALARDTTEPLLRAVLDLEDAYEVFAWLRELSFVESGRHGVFPHDLARDALDVDLRWRDPAAYRDVFRRVRAHTYQTVKVTAGEEQQRAIGDLKFMFRNLPSVLSPVDWDVWGQQFPDPARPSDHPGMLDLVATHEGQESAAVAERWLQRQPTGFFVLRDSAGAVGGLLGLLELTAASPDDRAADPGTQAAWEFALRHGPPRRGELLTLTRFVIDRDLYQAPSATMNATPVVTLQRFLHLPHLAWDFLTLADPGSWDDYFALADMPRARGADFVVGGRRYGLYAHDFRRRSLDALVELWTERALAQDFTPPRAAPDEGLVLSQPAFADAVRQGLRDLHGPDLLARNPLVRSRVVLTRGADDPAGTLRLVLDEAIATLRRSPRDDKFLRAVEATYVRAAGTQEAAAAALRLPFSTYRRHLTRGVEHITGWLWDREVYGTVEQR